MSRRCLGSIKPIAAVVFAMQLYGNMALSNDFNETSNVRRSIELPQTTIQGLKYKYEAPYNQSYIDKVDGLTLAEEVAAKAAHKKLYEVAKDVADKHVSGLSVDQLMYGNGFERFLKGLDKDKEYTSAEIFRESALDIHQMLTRFDPHAAFFDQKAERDFVLSLDDQKLQSGMSVIYTRTGYLKIKRLHPDGAAAQAGLRKGDIITRINGKRVSRIGFEKAKYMFDNDERFSFHIRRAAGDIDKPISFEKQALGQPSVTGYILNGNIAYIEIKRFSDNTRDDFNRLLKQMSSYTNGTLRGLVIDLYYNSGGKKTSVLGLLDDLTKQELLLKTVGKEQKIYRGNANTQVTDLPIVALVNNFSASAAEVFAGTLKDYGRAVIVGDGPSYGKATLQIHKKFNFEGDKDAGLRYTTAHVSLPLGGSYQYHGIQPDIIVPRSEAELKLLQEYEGPQSARDYEYYIPNPGGYKYAPPSYSCSVNKESNLVDYFDVKTGKTEERLDLKDNAAALCAIDILSDAPIYTTTKPYEPSVS